MDIIPVSMDHVRQVQSKLLKHIHRCERMHTSPFSTAPSIASRHVWKRMMRQEALGGDGLVNDVRIMLFSTRAHSVLFRTIQNELLYELETFEQKMQYVEFVLPFRTCAVDPAWIHTFMVLSQTSDQGRLDRVKRAFARVWAQMRSVAEDFCPLREISHSGQRMSRCHSYLQRTMTLVEEAIEPMREGALRVCREIMLGLQMPGLSSQARAQRFQVILGRKRTLVCASLESSANISCPICIEPIEQDKHVINQCGHFMCTDCFKRVQSADQSVCPECRLNLEPLGQSFVAHSKIARVEYFDAEGHRIATVCTKQPAARWYCQEQTIVEGRLGQTSPRSMWSKSVFGPLPLEEARREDSYQKAVIVSQ